MATSDRRRFLKGMLGAIAGAAGTVVLASSAAAKETAERTTDAKPESPADIQDRAGQLADAAGVEAQEVPVSAFVNGAFRNGGGGGGGFRNGGFANGGGGGFRNGGFANGAGGGFRNGAFRNW